MKSAMTRGNLSYVTQAMDISHGTLNRYFQEGEGCSAQAWFQMIRAEHAYGLLTNGAMSMEEVALKLV